MLLRIIAVIERGLSVRAEGLLLGLRRAIVLRPTPRCSLRSNIRHDLSTIQRHSVAPNLASRTVTASATSGRRHIVSPISYARPAQRIWQVLPLGPTGYGDSPYQCFSAFAGNPLLISLDTLVERGYLDSRQLELRPEFPDREVDFGAVIAWKLPLLRLAFKSFERASPEERECLRGFLRKTLWLARRLRLVHGTEGGSR